LTSNDIVAALSNSFARAGFSSFSLDSYSSKILCDLAIDMVLKDDLGLNTPNINYQANH
jgi:hypothetical protein